MKHIQGWTCHEDIKAPIKERHVAVKGDVTLTSSTEKGLKSAIERYDDKKSQEGHLDYFKSHDIRTGVYQ